MDKNILFSIDIPALAGQRLDVVRFTGYEELSAPYHFNIVLAGGDQVADGGSVIDHEATLTHHADAGDYAFHGIVSRFEVLEQSDKRTFYRVILVPRLWRATLDCNSRIFLDKTVPQCLGECLRGLGFSEGVDFELRLQRQYPQREYVSQYNESTCDFMDRWMEREGIYYFFDHSGQREKLVLTDTSMAHQEVQGAKPLQYAPPSGLNQDNRESSIPRLNVKRSLVPRTLQLQDYNYRTPGLKISAEKTVSESGIGTVYSYADNVKTPSEAETLATVRAQALACKELVCEGESASAFVRAGWLFGIQGHYEPGIDGSWLATQVHHGGNQEGYLFSGLRPGTNEDTYFYRNTFACIPAGTQYRTESRTARPSMDGAFGAHIDAAGSGKYAELDENGRYKVVMPWDRSGRKDGKASHWLRMAQPYGGGGHGMHFPLHKGTQAFLGFVDGDPDRPVIEGAAPDPEHPSQVTAETQTQCRITTKGQNKLHVEDKSGSQRMVISSPTAESYARMGAHNDPPPDWSPSETIAGWKLNTSKLFDVQAGLSNSVILGNSFTCILGWEHRQTGGVRMATVLGLNLGIFLAYTHEFAPLEAKIHALGVFLGIEKSKLIDHQVELAEERMEAAQEHVKLANNHVKVAQADTKLAEQRVELAAEKTELAQDKTSVADMETRIAGSHTWAIQNSLRAAQEATRIAERQTELCNTRTDAAETVFRVTQSKVQMAGSQSEIAESIDEICSAKTTIAAEQNDM